MEEQTEETETMYRKRRVGGKLLNKTRPIAYRKMAEKRKENKPFFESYQLCDMWERVRCHECTIINDKQRKVQKQRIE